MYKNLINSFECHLFIMRKIIKNNFFFDIEENFSVLINYDGCISGLSMNTASCNRLCVCVFKIQKKLLFVVAVAKI